MNETVEKVLDVGGFQISYTDTGAPDGRVLFCVHGLLSNGRDYDFFARYMAALGYRVISMDLPGRGKSDWFEDKTHYAPPFYIPYCLALISHVTEGREFDFFGVSLGGIIGMSLHNFEGVNIERLIIVDVGAEISANGLNNVGVLAKVNPVFDMREDAVLFLKERCAVWNIQSDDIWAHLIRHNITPHDAGGYRMHYDPAIGAALPDENETIDLWDLWDSIKQPVLLIRGGQSVLLPQGISAQMKARYQGQKIDEIVFENCGHVPNLMEDNHLKVLRPWFQHDKA